MHIYLETVPDSGVLKYRGETSANDNPDSFAEKMKKSGLRVLQHKKFQGNEIKVEEQ